MIFFHTYEADYWAGLQKHSLLGTDTGIKLTQCAGMGPGDMFNVAASPDSRLHRLISEAKSPFYIDRLQGGSFYYSYPFDTALLEEYDTLLGDDFYGFQMHEWASNYKQDWVRITENISGTPMTAENIFSAIERVSPDKENIYLEAGTPLEYSRLSFPASPDELLLQLRAHYRKRMRQTGGRLLPCDSYFYAVRMELEEGTKRIMPEVGAQIPHMRVQMAHARGMCKAYGKPFGAYYEPWGGKPFSVVVSRRDSSQNEWRIRQENFPFSFNEQIGMGGSSRLLQRRIYAYASLSGAEFLAEEWGAVNTFEEWTDFTLSAYGKVKKAFLDDARRLGNFGKPFAPVAIVLPKTLPVLDLSSIKQQGGENYLGYPLSGGKLSEMQTVSRALYAIFGRKNALGNEGHVMENSGFGDYFDIVYEDTPTLSQYDILVNMTCKDKLSAASDQTVIDAREPDEMCRALRETLKTVSPVWTDSDIHYTLCQNGDTWTLGLFNNEGVTRSVEKGDERDKAATLKAQFYFRAPCTPRLFCAAPDDCAIEKISDTAYAFTLTAGSMAIVQF